MNSGVSLPEDIVKYLKWKADEEYVSKAAIARRYLIKTITEEIVLKYHQRGYSFSKIAEETGTSVPTVLATLAKYGAGDEIKDIKEDYEIVDKMKTRE